MATIQLPQYCEDLLYPAILDRYMISDLVAEGGGVTTPSSLKVVAGSGLQVENFAGGIFIPGGESGTKGMYHVSSLSVSNPYNNVEVSAVNPQIAQIIWRVYDVNELKIGGSSYARPEWLNGSPNAGATKAHIEEGKASEFGAASLPFSSYRTAYVIVPKNATKSSEFEIIDTRTKSYTWPLNWVDHSKSAEAKVSEMLRMTATGTVTLPFPVANTIVGVFCSSGVATIKPNEPVFTIYGDFISNATSIKLLENQHVILQGNGSHWYIIAGEPNNEGVWGALIERAQNTSFTASATRPTNVAVTLRGEFGEAFIKVGEVAIATVGAAGKWTSYSFRCGANEKWEVVPSLGAIEKVWSSYKPA